MILTDAIKICKEMQNWKRGVEPYTTPTRMPYPTDIYNEAIDTLIEYADSELLSAVKQATEQGEHREKTRILSLIDSFFKTEYCDSYLCSKLREIITRK